jgi:hypothetical protein
VTETTAEIPVLGTPMEGEMREILGENATLRKITITYQDDGGMSCNISFLHDSYIEDEVSDE